MHGSSRICGHAGLPWPRATHPDPDPKADADPDPDPHDVLASLNSTYSAGLQHSFGYHVSDQRRLKARVLRRASRTFLGQEQHLHRYRRFLDGVRLICHGLLLGFGQPHRRGSTLSPAGPAGKRILGGRQRTARPARRLPPLCPPVLRQRLLQMVVAGLIAVLAGLAEPAAHPARPEVTGIMPCQGNETIAILCEQQTQEDSMCIDPHRGSYTNLC